MGKELPLISVIIPTYNSAKTIEACLEALIHVNYPLKSIEVIIVDSSSTDGTLNFIQEFRRTSGFKFKRFVTLVIKERGSSKARNIGVKNSEGDFIFFLDSDVIVPKNIFNLLLEHLRKQYVAMAAMPYITDYLNIYEKALYYRCPRPYGYVSFADMGAALIRSEIAHKIKFNERLGLPHSTWENTEYCAKLLRLGYKIVCDTRAVCRHLKMDSRPNVAIHKEQQHKAHSPLRYYFTKVGSANLEVLKTAPKKWVLRNVAYGALPLLAIILAFIVNPLFIILVLAPIFYHYFECKLGKPLEKLIISVLVTNQRTIVSYATLVEALKKLLMKL